MIFIQQKLLRTPQVLEKETSRSLGSFLQAAFILFHLLVSIMMVFLRRKRPRVILVAGHQRQHELAGKLAQIAAWYGLSLAHQKCLKGHLSRHDMVLQEPQYYVKPL